MTGPAPGIGDFGVTPLGGAAGPLIRIGQWLNGDGADPYVHAFVVVTAGRVMEARPDGAGYAPLGAYPDAVYWSCPDDRRDAVAAAAEALDGTPYSWVDYFALAAARLHLTWTSGRLRAYVASSRHMICSQLCDEAFLRAGVHLFDDGRDPGDVTPGDLYGLIRQQRAAAEGAAR